MPTQMHRIWTWLKDHQPQTAKSIASALHLPQANSLLSQMERRRMVSYSYEHDRSTGYTTKRYVAVGREYELLPMTVKATPRGKPAPLVALAPTISMTASPLLQSKPDAFPPWLLPTPAPQFDLDALTIAEARALYTRLARMFKGETA